LPAAKQDANPFESQGSQRGMVILTTLALLPSADIRLLSPLACAVHFSGHLFHLPKWRTIDHMAARFLQSAGFHE
jgi:hypothetical protein